MQKTQRQSDDTKSKTAGSGQSSETVESLREEIRRLSERISQLENSQLAEPHTSPPQQSETKDSDNVAPEIILAISAAIAAYLGVEPHIRQIRLLHSHPWGQQGRVTIQASHRIRAGHG
jgi:methylmalonyl-CoA carboxyltransferase large subunit